MSKAGPAFSIILVFAAIFFGNHWLSQEPYQGYIADPAQVYLARAETISIPGEDGDVELTLLAQYVVEGVVKGKHKYSDYPAQVSKYDFALAWGDLNNQEIDEQIKYSQGGRWYYYQYAQDVPLSGDYIAQHSANVHLIHKDQDILKKIKRIGKNEHVRIEGYLVNVNFKDRPWRTSLSRNDTGNGSCEIVYVTNVNIIE